MVGFAKELADIGLRSFEPRLAGAFYGSAQNLAPGAGVIYSGVTYAHFNDQTGRYEARRGPVVVLTHECETDVISTYRVWLVYELFRGTITKIEFEASEANLLEFISQRGTAKPYLARLVRGV